MLFGVRASRTQTRSRINLYDIRTLVEVFGHIEPPSRDIFVRACAVSYIYIPRLAACTRVRSTAVIIPFIVRNVGSCTCRSTVSYFSANDEPCRSHFEQWTFISCVVTEIRGRGASEERDPEKITGRECTQE